MRALIVCQAGKGIGLGHLSRCLVIAESLRERLGASIKLVIHGDRVFRDELCALHHEFIESSASLSSWLGGIEGVDVLILDLQPQRVPEDLGDVLRALRIRGVKVIVIDGLFSVRQDLDLVFIPSFMTPNLWQLESKVPVVSGWDCFLIDESSQAVEWTPGSRVLALTGGSDTTGLGQRWPALLDTGLPTGTELHWVTGPFSNPPVLPDHPNVAFREHVAPQGLASIMQTMNYAVTVYGVSVFELLRMGIPMVVFSPYCGKNDAELTAIAEAGVALVASDERDAVKKLAELMRDPSMASRLSNRARLRLPRAGGWKFASEVQRLYGGKGTH